MNKSTQEVSSKTGETNANVREIGARYKIPFCERSPKPSDSNQSKSKLLKIANQITSYPGFSDFNEK